MKTPPIHPAAELFPMLPRDELRALADDIKANGLREPVVMFQGKLLDGRNRWRACQLAGVKPKTRQWSGDSPTAFVISTNVRRRHLTQGQLAAVAVEALPMFEAEAKERQRKHGGTAPGRKNTGGKVATSVRGKSRDHAAKALGTSARYVSDVKALAKKAPHLVPKIKSGELTVPDAKAIAARDKEEQGAVLQKLDSGEAVNAKQALRQLNREQRITEIKKASEPLDLGGRRFPVILADNPWKYDDENSRGAAEDHYPTMELDEIKALPVEKHATDDAVLLLWATSPLLPEAIEVGRAWGFTYKASAVWPKSRAAQGHWFRIQHELVLLFTRGKMVPPREENRPSSIIPGKAAEHSRKPDELHGLIEKMWPELPKLELFARRSRAGWTVWGNQADGKAA